LKIILYESSSIGGSYDYSRELFLQYGRHHEVTSAEWVIPSSADVTASANVLKILCNDRKKFGLRIANRGHFLWRHFLNPLTLFFFLLKKQHPHVVILNDFEQMSAFLWVPLFSAALRRHRFVVVLHDPDRDAYPPSRKISAASMRILMSLMDLALYHEHLPDRSYYRPNGKTSYVQVPHGYYSRKKPDDELLRKLTSEKGSSQYVTIPGNIRHEKNYELAIQALASLPHIRLVIAGSPSSGSVDIAQLERLAEKLKVSDRVIWVKKYLSENEMAAVIESADLILLNYKPSFTSQSGTLNLVAPYRKKLLASRTQSSLTQVMERFNLGFFVTPDDLPDLIAKLPWALASPDPGNWKRYEEYASWENHVNIVIQNLKQI
jgi:glycosyltransferase involved in cell wall biosynthesis